MSAERLCKAIRCQAYRNEHIDGCPNPSACRGCRPKLAEPPLVVCNTCAIRNKGQLTELPRLYLDLLIPTRSGAGGGGHDPLEEKVPATIAEQPMPATDAVLECRERIRMMYRYWGNHLAKHYDTPRPGLLDSPDRYLYDYSRSLLADIDDAPLFAEEVSALHRDAVRLAYPAGPRGQLLGQCPACLTPVRASSFTARVTCPGCGVVGDVDDWRRLLVGEVPAGGGSATGADLIAWLTVLHQRHISATALRLWAANGVKVNQRDGSRRVVRLTRTGRNARGQTLYSVADARMIARQLFGPGADGDDHFPMVNAQVGA